MAVNIPLFVYSDFKDVVAALPVKTQVFYGVDGTGNQFSAIAASSDFDYLVGVALGGAIPATFLTDFPSAILLQGMAGGSPVQFFTGDANNRWISVGS